MQLRAADLFCGAGGTSIGAHATGGASIVFALNHWSRAIETHSANFPRTKHVNSRLEDTSPSECGKIDLLFASPECTHHSKARGGRPTSDQQRSGAWHVLPWIEFHRPSWVVIENVIEWRDWGPIGPTGKPLISGKGKFFDAWVMAVRAAGYRIDYRALNAADLGAATSRTRLFLVARKGNRNPVFPEPTHIKELRGALPGMGLDKWRAASEVIDWSIPCPSIFGRKRPLADKTLLRIEAGLRRFVGPFVAQWDNQNGNGGYTRPISGPLATMTTKANMGLVTPYQVILRNKMDAAGVDSPLSTITAGGGHHGVAVPFLADVNHGGSGLSHGRSRSVSHPLGTMTAKNGKAMVTPFVLSTGSGGAPRGTECPLPTIVTKDATALYVPWLSHYYGTNNQSPPNEPVDTITTKGRHSLCVARIGSFNDLKPSDTPAMRTLRDTMREMGVADIGFRMLSNPELAAAQGFPSDYQFSGTKADITRQIGNSVSPPVAEAITRSILSV